MTKETYYITKETHQSQPLLRNRFDSKNPIHQVHSEKEGLRLEAVISQHSWEEKNKNF
jgi:hypothetical protein